MSGDAAREAFHAALAEDDPERLYDRAPCGYLSTTPDGLIVKVNQTFLTWTGYQRAELVGKRAFVELLTAGGRIYHETHYAPMLRMQGSASEIALEIVCADGRRLPALVNSTLERDGAGAAVAVRTAVFDATDRRAYEQELLRARQRAEESEARARQLARTLQQTLLPLAPPDIPGIDVAAAYRPAGTGEEVGGDFYDVFEIGGNEWIVVIGDVCGKGVDAAVVTALVRHTIRAAAVRQHRPSEVLRTVNEVLRRHPTGLFCTAAVLRLRRSNGFWSVAVSCGGHPLPIMLPPARGPRMFGAFGTLLGVVDRPRFPERETRLRPGTALLLYTDGVTEARQADEFFGEERLLATVARHAGSARAITEHLLDEVLRFQADHPRDDIAIVTVRVPRA